MGNCFDSLSRVETPGHSGNNAFSGAPTSKTYSSSQDASYGSMDTSSGEITTTGANLRAFTFGDLKTATRNFRADNVLGEGGFGRVFKGYIDEHTFLPSRAGQGMVVAVKKLNLEGFQGHREWLAEVHFLGAFHHQNLVKLIGFCAEDDHRLLVYEFMPRGSLENHLFRKGNTNLSLSWEIRMKIAVGAARGLAVLHDAERPVIYRDFKASNILLDSQFNAKLSDFGLAKDGPTGDNTHVSTRVMGTYGYAAPEYVATGHLTPKSDIYSFGVVLLEILTGRRAVDKNRPVGEQNLVDWAKPYLNDRRKVLRLVDQRLEGQYSLKGAQRAANVALHCLNPEAKNRPTMKEILATLEPLLNAGKAHSLEGRNRVQDNLKSTMTHPLPINGATKQGNGISPYQSPNIADYVGRRQE